MIAYSVEQRTRELGVRLALGAMPRQVFGLVVREGMAMGWVNLGFSFAAIVGTPVVGAIGGYFGHPQIGGAIGSALGGAVRDGRTKGEWALLEWRP